MRSIREYLKPYGRAESILGGKILALFSKIIAPYGKYDALQYAKALDLLGQSEGDPRCVYCGNAANDWDHLRSPIRNKVPTGYGHMLGNLVPSCSACNKSKLGKNWDEFLAKKNHGADELRRRLDQYMKEFPNSPVAVADDWTKLVEIRQAIIKLLREADEIAVRIHAQRRDG